jgi:diguanylate cyclase (GGDEF)-like protein
MAERINNPYKHLIVAGLMFFVGACLSVYLWDYQRRGEKDLVNQKFLQETNILKNEIQKNLETYGQLVNNLSGLFNAVKPVTENEWNAYMETVKKLARQYPGIAHIGFSLSEPDKETVVFSTLFNKHDDNLIGKNLLNYPNRKRVIERSSKTGNIELANQLHSIKEGASSEETPYFGLFSPIFNKDSNTVYGHVFVEIDFYSMITRLFNGQDKGVMLKISFKNIDGSDQVLYEALDNSMKDKNVQLFKPASIFSQVTTIEFNKTTWSVYFYSTSHLDNSIDKVGPAIFFFSCILVSFFGSIVVWSLNMVNDRSKLLHASNNKILMLNKELENKVKVRTKELEIANLLLEKTNSLVSLKNELLSLMQTCGSIKEVLILVGEFFKRMFPENSGRIYFYNRHSLMLDLVSFWGEEAKKSPDSIKMGDCFALHYFHPYRVKGINSEMICGHILQENSKLPYFCLPIMDNENIFGLITISMHQDDQDRLKESVENIEKTISLTCLNLDLKRQLEYDAIHDPLTGLYNRRYFEENLLREIMKSSRSPIEFNILMIDIDDFKKINDKYGHQMGDEVLKGISNMFKHDVRSSDLACRFGGEEFIIMMETSIEYGYKRAEQLRKKMAALTFSTGDKTLSNVTISVGLAAYPKHADSMEGLIRDADEALYKAKSLGKNKVIIFGEWNNPGKIENL